MFNLINIPMAVINFVFIVRTLINLDISKSGAFAETLMIFGMTAVLAIQFVLITSYPVMKKAWKEARRKELQRVSDEAARKEAEEQYARDFQALLEEENRINSEKKAGGTTINNS